MRSSTAIKLSAIERDEDSAVRRAGRLDQLRVHSRIHRPLADGDVLEELTEEQLVSILTEPKNALTKQYAKLMAMEGVELEFTPDALHELAAQAHKEHRRARAAQPARKADARRDVRSASSGDILPSRSPAPSCWRNQADHPPQTGPGGGLKAERG